MSWGVPGSWAAGSWGAGKLGAGQLGVGELGAGEVRVGELVSWESGSCGSGSLGASKLRARELGRWKLGSWELGSGERTSGGWLSSFGDVGGRCKHGPGHRSGDLWGPMYSFVVASYSGIRMLVESYSGTEVSSGCPGELRGDPERRAS